MFFFSKCASFLTTCCWLTGCYSSVKSNPFIETPSHSSQSEKSKFFKKIDQSAEILLTKFNFWLPSFEANISQQHLLLSLPAFASLRRVHQGLDHEQPVLRARGGRRRWVLASPEGRGFRLHPPEPPGLTLINSGFRFGVFLKSHCSILPEVSLKTSNDVSLEFFVDVFVSWFIRAIALF